MSTLTPWARSPGRCLRRLVIPNQEYGDTVLGVSLCLCLYWERGGERGARRGGLEGARTAINVDFKGGTFGGFGCRHFDNR